MLNTCVLLGFGHEVFVKEQEYLKCQRYDRLLCHWGWELCKGVKASLVHQNLESEIPEDLCESSSSHPYLPVSINVFTNGCLEMDITVFERR